jgi:hypothetical protein
MESSDRGYASDEVDLTSSVPREPPARKRDFYRAAMRVKALIYEATDGKTNLDNVSLHWVKAIQKLSSMYNVRLPIPFKISKDSDYRKDKESLDRLLLSIEEALDTIDLEIKIDDAIEGSDNRIELSADWKERATAYVFHIRAVVSKAEVNESIRERILKRLGELQIEIDKNRTRVGSISEVFLSLAEAVGQGAQHLEGAVKLVERLAGALSGARSAKVEHDTQLRLPAPEKLGLPPPDKLGLSDLE